MHEFLHYLTMGYLVGGIGVTLEITGGAFLVGLVGGALLAAVQLTKIPLLTGALRLFSLVTRGTPVLLQLLFVYDVLPTVGISLPAVTTAIVVLGVNTITFFSEIMRGSVLSLERGQTMAAQSLGMSPLVLARYVVSPQAIRVALPQLANQTVVLILTSSLASTISVSELTLRSETIASSNFQVIPVYLASGLMYLVLTSIVSAVQIFLERALDLNQPAESPKGWRIFLRRVAGTLVTRRSISQVTGLSVGTAAPVPVPVPVPLDAELAAVRAGDHLDGQRPALPGDVPVGEELKRVLAEELASPPRRAGTPMLEVQGLRKRYGDQWALKGLDLEVQPGEVVVIMGASGCGKSTLLRCVAQLESLDEGEVFVAGTRFGRDNLDRALKGRRLAAARAEARVAMVFQNFELFKHMSVLRNVTVALETVYAQRREVAEARARRLLRTVGLEAHAEKLPRQLSGGQQQRVAIARGLATAPRLMLLDEPTSALDPEMVHEVLTVLRALASAGMTMLVVTHEVKFAMEIADRLVFMANGEILESGRPDEVLTSPSREATRSFLRLLEV